jgi:tetratricopeptide (TPR) repeat protein
VGRLEPAIAELEDTLRAAERAYAAGHPTVAAIQSNLAELYVQAGRAREGTALAERALAFMEKKLGKEHRRLAPFADTLAGCLLEEGRPAEALAWSRRAVALQGEDPAGKDLNLAGYLVGLGRARLAVGQATAAVEALERAARALEGGGALPEDVAEAQDWLARALWQAGKDRRRAVELAEAARAGYAAGGPRSRRRLVELEAWLGPRRPR